MPQTGNTKFSPGSPNGCGKGFDWEKYVRGDKKFLRHAAVGYLRGDSSKARQVSGLGAKVMFGGIVEKKENAEVDWLEARVS